MKSFKRKWKNGFTAAYFFLTYDDEKIFPMQIFNFVNVRSERERQVWSSLVISLSRKIIIISEARSFLEFA